MATAAQPTGLKLRDHQITMTGGAGPQKVVISATRQEHVELSDGSIHAIPLGAKMFVTARRQCGDWYAEIEGRKHVSATGATQDDAMLAVIAKAA